MAASASGEHLGHFAGWVRAVASRWQCSPPQRWKTGQRGTHHEIPAAAPAARTRLTTPKLTHQAKVLTPCCARRALQIAGQAAGGGDDICVVGQGARLATPLLRLALGVTNRSVRWPAQYAVQMVIHLGHKIVAVVFHLVHAIHFRVQLRLSRTSSPQPARSLGASANASRATWASANNTCTPSSFNASHGLDIEVEKLHRHA